MKKKKLIYLVTSALIVLIGAVTVAIVNKNEYVSGNSSYKAAVSDWNEMISNQVNSKGISISVDGSIKVSGDTSVAYMNRSKTVMISVDSLSDLLNCAVNVYDDNIVLVEKGSNVVEFDILNKVCSRVPPSDEEEVYSFLVEEGLLKETGYGFEITHRGRIVIHGGGYAARVSRERLVRLCAYIGAVSGVIAATLSLIALLR